jgi:hypothetical protein
MPTRTSRFLNALRDLALIVAGVLIALAVDQAAETVGERRREAEYLVALQEDVKADLAALRGPLSEGLDRREAAAQLVVAGLNGLPLEPAQLVAALDRAGHVAFFAPRRATFDDLISTGNLRLIRDREIRAADTVRHSTKFSTHSSWLRSRSSKVMTRIAQSRNLQQQFRQNLRPMA